MNRQKQKTAKTSSDEVAYDLPKELDFRKLTPVGFGLKALDAFERNHRLTVRLDSDVAKVFRDSQAVNEVLRAIISNMPTHRRKSA